MIAVFPLLFFGYKFVRKTRLWAAEEMDLVKNLEEIEEYQRTFVPIPPRYAIILIMVYRIHTDFSTEIALRGYWIGSLNRCARLDLIM